MPLLVNRYIFSLAPGRAPFFLRPLLKFVFSALDAQVVAGPLKASLQYVCRPYLELACSWSHLDYRSKKRLRNLPPAGSLVVRILPWPII